MPVISIGTDICDVKRIRDIEEKHKIRFLEKVFTSEEIEYCEKKIDKHISLAARFAAKEALLKALGTGLRDGLQWKEIEVVNDDLGKPSLRFSGHVERIISDRKVLLSLSHTSENAIAFVLIEGEPFNDD
jgi:holo-[acyl-carrier protein] synthase